MEKPKVKYDLTLVTPKMASEFLKLNTKNRKISESAVYQYGKDMESGHFKFNGHSVCISDKGVLLDGQQRLMASVESKKPFWTMLIEGLDEDVMVTIDTGRKRTFANQLQIREYPNASLVAATVSQLGLIAIGSPKNVSQYLIAFRLQKEPSITTLFLQRYITLEIKLAIRMKQMHSSRLTRMVRKITRTIPSLLLESGY
jgi:hypothetical protein